MKLSLLEKADMNFEAKVEETKYLTNYFLQGTNKSNQPENWDYKLEEIKRKLDWTPENVTFAKLAAQVRHFIVLAFL